MLSAIPIIFSQNDPDKHKHSWLLIGSGVHDKLWYKANEPYAGWRGAPALRIYINSGEFTMSVSKNDSAVQVNGCLSRKEVKELIQALSKWLEETNDMYPEADVNVDELRKISTETEPSRT